MMETILKKISALRIRKGMPQKNVAEVLHVTASTYYKMEMGVIKITLSKLLLIAQALEVDCAALLDQEDPEQNLLEAELEEDERLLSQYRSRIIEEQGKLISLLEKNMGYTNETK
jgi:transcriptional regulator with XRE-family HTH domain